MPGLPARPAEHLGTVGGPPPWGAEEGVCLYVCTQCSHGTEPAWLPTGYKGPVCRDCGGLLLGGVWVLLPEQSGREREFHTAAWIGNLSEHSDSGASSPVLTRGAEMGLSRLKQVA